MNLKRFDIGDWVEVRAITKVQTVKGNRKIFREDVPPFCARVTGVVVRQTGIIKCDFPDYEYGGSPCFFFSSTGRHVFWAVRRGMMNKEILVQDNDISSTTLATEEKFRVLCIEQRPWTKKDRERQQEDCRLWPRDAKGRWTKV